DQLGPRVDAEQVFAVAQTADLLLAAADEEEPAEIAAVRLEEGRLPAIDLARLLQPSPELDRLAEYLGSLLLTPPNRPAEADEEPVIRHFSSSSHALRIAKAIDVVRLT